MPKTAGTPDEGRERNRQFCRTMRRRNRLECLTGGAAPLFLLFMGATTPGGAASAAERVTAAGFLILALGLVLAGLYLFRRNRRPARSRAFA